MINDIGGIKSLINHQDWSKVKKISILKANSSNFCKNMHTFWSSSVYMIQKVKIWIYC